MVQRTTITAQPDDLETLRAEARRSGLSLARYMQGVIADRAAEIRAVHRPRFGVAASGGVGVARESVMNEDAPARSTHDD